MCLSFVTDSLPPIKYLLVKAILAQLGPFHPIHIFKPMSRCPGALAEVDAMWTLISVATLERDPELLTHCYRFFIVAELVVLILLLFLS